ncbi:MAPEG family protein [Litoreibacter arenae]|uniref:MAPEG family protein n=1 Tax=Litoreibacter arenae DSM 19593 TaxID=1123360 RepID=S9S292_9RHOB|nr:MAPEG family protein [Litoreibacter arenae]EPX80334.1 hypothetical protein thalar_01674 [Litoreibacter arenae DSM 19593]
MPIRSLLDAVPYLAAYDTSFVVLAALSLVVLIRNFATAPLAYASEEQVPGMPLQHDHSKLSFRAIRTYANSAETFPAFGWALLVAIIAGASPLLVNWLAALYRAWRLAFWVVYYTAALARLRAGPEPWCSWLGCCSTLSLPAPQFGRF